MSTPKPPSDLALLEGQLRTQQAFSALTQSHVHRAVREDSLGFLISRDAILADWTQQESANLRIIADFGDMIGFEVGDGAEAWQGHRWIVREGERIVTETSIENRGHLKIAPQAHMPLGELRSARGQYDAGDKAILPADFPEAARSMADLLHQAWNGRAFNLYKAPWLVKIVRTLPDATFYFERALAQDNQYAILWRVHGHHAAGQRIRLIGSSVMTLENGVITSDHTAVDFAALDAQLDRDLISYAESVFRCI